ncbi:MAG: ABC transporter ATP-binding protein [Planctomycetota bacterium]|nr:ABC transporter ATP-binding protein [Planctomycetota bacterium]MDA1158710.1 ABC transporter ATP-binding protein [Planctomycetota bacterium]
MNAPSNDVPMIEASGLSKSFGTARVLLGVDLTIPRGSVTGLLGKNGSGKSTLLKCLLGLLKPSSGTARILGEDGWNLSAEAKAQLGYVAQEVSLYSWMRVQQIIEYTAAFYPTWNQELAIDLAKRWELPTEDRVGPMSQGQQQKLALVLALGHEPDLLILDEPVASLDPSARREFLSTLLEVTRDENRTVLFSTHITTDLERVADHVAVLKEGKIVYHDQLDDLKESVKRLRVTSESDLPSSFGVANSLRAEVSGKHALVAVAEVGPTLVAEIESRWQASVTVEDLSLEEIFLEMHGDA